MGIGRSSRNWSVWDSRYVHVYVEDRKRLRTSSCHDVSSFVLGKEFPDAHELEFAGVIRSTQNRLAVEFQSQGLGIP